MKMLSYFIPVVLAVFSTRGFSEEDKKSSRNTEVIKETTGETPDRKNNRETETIKETTGESPIRVRKDYGIGLGMILQGAALLSFDINFYEDNEEEYNQVHIQITHEPSGLERKFDSSFEFSLSSVEVTYRRVFSTGLLLGAGVGHFLYRVEYFLLDEEKQTFDDSATLVFAEVGKKFDRGNHYFTLAFLFPRVIYSRYSSISELEKKIPTKAASIWGEKRIPPLLSYFSLGIGWYL